jgi:hypothetical protein
VIGVTTEQIFSVLFLRGASGKSTALEGAAMRNHNQPRKPNETKEQYQMRRARGAAANIMGFMAECREGAGWPPAKAEMIDWFMKHRARLHLRLAIAAQLP